MQSNEIKKGILIKMGNGLGIILQDKMKFQHYNYYAWVYYFDSAPHVRNPSWVFIENLKKVSN